MIRRNPANTGCWRTSSRRNGSPSLAITPSTRHPPAETRSAPRHRRRCPQRRTDRSRRRRPASPTPRTGRRPDPPPLHDPAAASPPGPPRRHGQHALQQPLRPILGIGLHVSPYPESRSPPSAAVPGPSFPRTEQVDVIDMPHDKCRERSEHCRHNAIRRQRPRGRSRCSPPGGSARCRQCTGSRRNAPASFIAFPFYVEI